MEIKIINNEDEFPEFLTKKKIIDFLYEHLDEFGDPKEDIERSIDYAFSSATGKGGYLLAGIEGEELVGALVMNHTGMKNYIPEDILVYVAVHKNHRGKGIGTKIIEKAFKTSDGDIALHVEYNNPAKRLYERIGFESKYAEMRYKKEKN